MEIDLYQILLDNPIGLLFLVIGLGLLTGKIRIMKLPLGSTVGVLLAGLLFGHLGFQDIPGVDAIGFALFIFSVGIQAGPGFFSVFLEDGLKYIALAAVVAVVGIGLAIIWSRVVGLEAGFDAGILAGALTSTPTLAGAIDAVNSGIAMLPEGMTQEMAADNISVGYAITYLFGTAGTIAILQIVPRFMRVDLATEARKVAEKKGLLRRWLPQRPMGADFPLIRAYQVHDDSPTAGITLAELKQQQRDKDFRVLRVKRGDKIIEPTLELLIEKGDVLSIFARLAAHQEVQDRVAGEVLDPELLNYSIESNDIVVTKKDAVGKPLKTLNITSEYACFANGVIRSGIELPVSDNLTLNKGDRLLVTGEKDHLERLADKVGHVEARVETTDLLTFSFGMVGGTLLGVMALKVGDFSLGLGKAGGLLLAGILIGYLRSVYPTFGRLPDAARHLLMELGLMLFMANVGLRAGDNIVEILMGAGPELIAGGIVITLSTALIGYFFGRYVLRLNPALLLGSIAGAMTSTTAMDAVARVARSSVPALGYAGTYTFANVLLTFGGTLIMVL
jgi:putative transport protein